MFISGINIKNYRVFKDLSIPKKRIGIPDGENKGSGLTVLLGENGNGKTSILDAITLGLATYTTENFSFSDLNSISKDMSIVLHSDDQFTVKRAVGGDFQCKGLIFKAHVKKTVSKQYLNRVITSDNLFISTDSSDPKKNSPDLRVSVNNPFGGPRFNDNEYAILDSKRTNHLRRGVYSSTRFDNLLADYCLKYLKLPGDKKDFNEEVDEEFQKILAEDDSLAVALKEFNDLTGFNVAMTHIDNLQPFSGSFLAQRPTNESPLIPPPSLGEGYHILLGLLVYYYSSIKTNKDLIVVIDEVEIHLHPAIQKIVIDLLLRLSKTAQVFITSHSTEAVKQLAADKNHKTIILQRNKEGEVYLDNMAEYRLPLPTAAETNYLAFSVATLEYHNELFGHAMEASGESVVAIFDKKLGIGDADKFDWINSATGSTVRLSVHSVIRHYFHHPNSVSGNSYCTPEFINDNLISSIIFLRDYIEKNK